jgi:excisionase family DNA binding protein
MEPGTTLMQVEITPRWLSLANASKYSGLSVRTLNKAVKSKSFKSYLNGRKRLIDRESLDAWIEGKPLP